MKKHELIKKARQFGKHARWMIRGTKGVKAAPQELIEAVKKKDQTLLAVEEGVKEKARILAEEERERRRVEKREKKERAKLLAEREKQIREEAKVEEERRKQGEKLAAEAMGVYGAIGRPVMGKTERELVESLSPREKEAFLRSLDTEAEISFDEIAQKAGRREDPLWPVVSKEKG